jgi:tetratricopeptide (TPR) repeat protein
MLQKGPLASILYKDSISVRGYYWRAALEMFFAKPIFGVGTDQYGSFFRFYKDSSYVVRYGSEITSSNAHNVFLQLFSTCGLITGCCYIIITFGILNIALRKIIKDETNQDILFLGLFVAWISFQMQSLISIDNIALSIWGWVFGGLLLNKSLNLSSQELNSRKFTNYQVVISAVVLLPVFVFCTFLYRSETAMLRQLQYANLQYSEQNKSLYIESARRVLDNPFSDAYMKKLTAEKMYGIGFKREALNTFDKLVSDYPSNSEYLMSRAIARYALGDVNGSMNDRIKLLELDPWNLSNLLQLGEIYKSLGSYGSMLEIRSRIESFAAQTPEGIAAKNNLVLP